MERELVEAVRRLFDTEPTAELPSFLELAHPEIEIRPLVTWPGMDPSQFRGPRGVEAYFKELEGGFGRIRYELQDLSEHGDALIADTLVRAEGRESGITTTVHSFQLIRIEDGLVRSVEGYASRDEALAAAD